MTPGLELQDVVKAYPGFELGPLSKVFAPGRVHGLLGPNGAGKTTLLNVITLQARVNAGQLFFGGEPIAWGQAAWKQRLAYVRETPAFYDELTVGETLRFAGRLYGRWDSGLASVMTRRLGLALEKPVRTLSKGTRVKLGIVTALAQRADLLILDEPTAGVDPTARVELHEMLRELRQARPELCVLLSSHIFEDIDMSADDVAILRDGQVAFDTTRDQLAAMALYRLPNTAGVPPSEGVRLTWVADGRAWVLARPDSAAGLRLRATSGCDETRADNSLAVIYHGIARGAMHAL